MEKIYLVGYLYDDFSSGGFSIVNSSNNKEEAIKIAEDLYKPSSGESWSTQSHLAVAELEVGAFVEDVHDCFIHTTRKNIYI